MEQIVQYFLDKLEYNLTHKSKEAVRFCIEKYSTSEQRLMDWCEKRNMSYRREAIREILFFSLYSIVCGGNGIKK